jgi:hypothetical protein
VKAQDDEMSLLFCYCRSFRYPHYPKDHEKLKVLVGDDGVKVRSWQSWQQREEKKKQRS